MPFASAVAFRAIFSRFLRSVVHTVSCQGYLPDGSYARLAHMPTSTALLVEDNASDELLTLRALKKHTGITNVDVARDGAEALDYLFRRSAYADRLDEPPTIVLLDLNMPKMGGLEVLLHMRANPKTELIPVVILTSSDEERDFIAGYMNGANSYVRKPVAFDDFEEAVRSIGLYWLTLNHTPPLRRTAS
jgi:two-component system response regulator